MVLIYILGEMMWLPVHINVKAHHAGGLTLSLKSILQVPSAALCTFCSSKPPSNVACVLNDCLHSDHILAVRMVSPIGRWDMSCQMYCRLKPAVVACQ